MLQPDPASLIKTLNNYCTKSLERAAAICVSRTHYEVTVEHFLSQLLIDPNADAHLILHHYGVDKGRLEAALLRHLEAERSGNSSRPVLSPLLLGWLRDAWLLASTELKLSATRSGALLTAFLLAPHSYSSGAYGDLLAEIPRDELRRKLLAIVAGSIEMGESAPGKDLKGADTMKASGPHSRGADTALGKFTIDFTAQARSGQLDPVIGRESEIRQCIDILARRRKNNPIIVGEAGVGKTALVEGIAQRVVAKEVPTQLAEVDILGLDLGLLQAGAGVKGEFENRLKSVIEEVKASPKPIILFIDEAHTMIGAGGPAGGSDAANLLKPSLARGELRTLAATTWSEYKKYFEKDPALTRRFQLVKVDEPSEENAIAMMRGLAPFYEKSHGIRLRDDAVMAAVQLSNRYISGRQLPDKAVDLLDTCAARVAIAQQSKPAEILDLERTIQILEQEQQALSREMAEGSVVDEAQVARVEEQLTSTRDRLKGIETQWESQCEAVQKVIEIRKKLIPIDEPHHPDLSHGENSASENSASATDQDNQPNQVDAQPTTNGETCSASDDPVQPEPASSATPDQLSVELRQERDAALEQLQTLYREGMLVPLDVTRDLVAKVVADWTGIPVGKMVQDEAATLLSLEQRISERIRGQRHALTLISEGIRAAKMGLGNPRAPIGVFLLVGPSGVGKTETGRVLADQLFGGERFMVTINMSEFQEKHTVSRLIGSPPGYVGYGEGGVLTEAVRQRPYSAVMLDEVEKADPEVMNLFYQVFDKGELADGEGRVIDFKNTVVLLTSNLGSEVMTEIFSRNPSASPEQVLQAIRPILIKRFKPALLARMTLVPFLPLSSSAMREIVDLKLKQLQERIQDSHHIQLTIKEQVAEQITERCSEVETGARNIDHILSRTLLPLISQSLLSRMTQGPLPTKFELILDEQGSYQLNFDSPELNESVLAPSLA